MTRELPYTIDILRLAASLPVRDELEGADGTGEARSPACGSTLRTMVRMDGGRIGAIVQKVTACAYGQASAALVQGWAPGRLRAEVIVMRAAVKAWLDGRGEVPQGFTVLGPVQGRAGRHGAVLLPFDALLKALETQG
jgi:NifU-like protein involved in Fe-S cluster formation